MKKSAVLVFLVFALCTLAQLEAQTRFNPNSQKLYYTHSLDSVSTAYVTNTKDTSLVITVGGASAITFTVTVADTALMDYFVDYKVVGTNTSWNVGLTDSLINNGASSNSGLTKEFPFRSPGTEKYAGLVYQIRTRKNWRNVTQGVTSATFTEKLNYKP